MFYTFHIFCHCDLHNTVLECSLLHMNVHKNQLKAPSRSTTSLSSACRQLKSVPIVSWPTTRLEVTGTRLLRTRESCDIPRFRIVPRDCTVLPVCIQKPLHGPRMQGAFRLPGRVEKFPAFKSAQGLNTLQWLSVEGWGMGALPVHCCR